MGCCISRPSGPNSPYPGGGSAGADASARAINSSPPSHQATTTTTSPPTAQPAPSTSPTHPINNNEPRRHRRHSHRQHTTDNNQPPLSQHINKPLRRHEWISKPTAQQPPWTPRRLRRERAEFFDTRVTGRQEIWQALRAALELMWEADTVARDSRVRQQAGGSPGTTESEQVGGVTTTTTHTSSEADRAAALATAQTILSAAEITLPTGDLANGAYDAFGGYYALPEQVVSDPIDICFSDAEGEEVLGDVKGEFNTFGEETAEEEDEEDEEEEQEDEEAVRRREEKGKSVVDIRDQVPLRARLSEGDRDVMLSVGRGESVRSVARRVAEEALLPSTKHIRLAYMGKILKDPSSLLAQGWKQGHVVNALVFARDSR